MKEMKCYANKYDREHYNSGHVVKCNDYSFTWETYPDKNGKTTTVVFMKSYFAKVCK